MNDRHNVGRIAERIVANELEYRGFRVSDLNKDGMAPNADLLAVKGSCILQIQVKGASNAREDIASVQIGYCTQEVLDRTQPMFNRRNSFYHADYVILVSVHSLTNYHCIIMPATEAERAVQVHLDRGFRMGKRSGEARKPGRTRVSLEPLPRGRGGDERWAEERELLAT